MSLLPRGKQIWKKHVEIYTDIFRQALLALSEMPSLIGKNETTISRRLNDLVQQKCFAYDRDLAYPICETPIVPEETEEEYRYQETGCPDFSCRLKNPHASSCRESEFDFHIECKCLGSPTSSSWILNKNYVNHGIMRFDLKDKRYGENVPDGMMIGYVISMNAEDICKEVNAELVKTKRKFTPISFSPSSDLLKETTQQIKRIVITPPDFTLIHLWIILNHSDAETF